MGARVTLPPMSRSRRRREQGHPAKIAARRELKRNRSRARSPAAEFCATAAGFSSPLHAELAVSEMLGYIWEERDLEAPDDHELKVGAHLVDDIADQGNPGAAILLSAFRELAGQPLAARAAEHVEALAAQPLPNWAAAIGSARPERVAVMSEPIFDDGRTYFIESVADDGSRHAVGIFIDNNFGRAAKDILLADSIERVEEVMARRPEEGQALTIADVDPADAAARIRGALAITDRTVSPALEEDYAQYRALAWSRVRALPDVEPDEAIPEVTEAEREALHGEFLAAPEAAGIEAESEAADVVSTAIDFAADYVDGRPLRWSPVVVELFMADWLPRKVVADDEYFAAVPDALDAWVRFTARKRELPDDALAETVEAVSVFKDDLAEALDAAPEDADATNELVAALREANIDISDEQALQTFIAGWNARSTVD